MDAHQHTGLIWQHPVVHAGHDHPVGRNERCPHFVGEWCDATKRLSDDVRSRLRPIRERPRPSMARQDVQTRSQCLVLGQLRRGLLPGGQVQVWHPCTFATIEEKEGAGQMRNILLHGGESPGCRLEDQVLVVWLR